MIEDQSPCNTKFTQSQSWSVDYFSPNDWKSKRIIRKFINSAIYVEKPMFGMPPLRKKSPIYINNGSDSEYTCRTYTNINQTKRVTSSCTSLQSLGNYENVEGKKSSSHSSETSSTNTSSNMSQITVKSKKHNTEKIENEMKLSLTSLSTDKNYRVDLNEKQEIINQWLQRKNEEQNKKRIKEQKIKEEKEKQRQLHLEKERENFKKWLAQKKQIEERNRKLKEVEEEEKKQKEVEKEKRRIESEICFNKWLRKKKKIELERKIKEKLALIQIYEQKQKRIEENEKVFQEWLKRSKNKPKPIPLNQGLRSLCSSTSVTYINPIPWVPNIELPEKPVSQ